MPISVSLPSFLAMLVCLTTSCFAVTPDQAKALSQAAAAYIEQGWTRKRHLPPSRGASGAFVDGELHVFCYDRNGVNRAEGGNPALAGRNLLHIKDPDGVEPVALIIRKGFEQDAGWVVFMWPNPVSKKIEGKIAYLIRTNDVVCGVGYYKQ